MKQVLSLTLIAFFATISIAPAFALDIADGEETISNISRGYNNVRGSFSEVVAASADEASKGSGAVEEISGAAVGGIIGVRKGIHRLGAGAIDLLTFWIPKDEPLITPEEHPLK